MIYDPYYKRYVRIKGIFFFSMAIVIVSNDILITFILWEVIGLTSSLLISFWYSRIATGRASLKALIINKIGDIGFINLWALNWFF